jgi:hypothetical protein
MIQDRNEARNDDSRPGIQDSRPESVYFFIIIFFKYISNIFFSIFHQEVLKALVYIKIRVDQRQIVDQRDTHH